MKNLPTRSEVEASCERYVTNSDAELHELRRILDIEVPQIGSNLDKATAVKQLTEVGSRINDLITKNAACSRGCSSCCHMAVGISYYEALAISEYTGRGMHTVNELEDAKTLATKYRGQPCTFLVNGECSIYEVRPIACRTYANVSEYPELCENEIFGDGSTPSINLDDFYTRVARIIGPDVPWGDIRDFFKGDGNGK